MKGQQKPPYRPSTQQLGETPLVIPDVPICGVFILLFAIGAAIHMKTFKGNLKNGKKFVPSVVTFGACAAIRPIRPPP